MEVIELNNSLLIRIELTDSDGTSVSGADVSYSIKSLDGTTISSGSLVEESSGIYSTTIAPVSASLGERYEIIVTASKGSLVGEWRKVGVCRKRIW